jgi:hypothetical protein
MGGTDAPENLVSLSISDHADAHKKLYEQFGKKEDFVAWKALAGQILREEIQLERSSIGGLNNRGKNKLPSHIKKISESISELQKFGRPDVVKEKISKSMSGEKNHMFGKDRGDQYSETQSNAMKEAWARRKAKSKA